MARRLTDWLADSHSVDRVEDDTAAAVAVLALSLDLMMSAFAGPEIRTGKRRGAHVRAGVNPDQRRDRLTMRSARHHALVGGGPNPLSSS
jgi:hypothetical protein